GGPEETGIKDLSGSEVKMDDPDITMEEYIQLEVEKAIDMVRRLTRKLLRMSDKDNNDDEIDVELCLEIISTKPFDGVIDANVDR
nr:hypothetical protein [Tanacetum cinerariifolium]